MADLPASVLPASAASFVAHFRAKPPFPVQSSITHRITTLSLIARVSETARGRRGISASTMEFIRLDALQVAESPLWLRTLPSERGFTFSNLKWQWASWLRLGVPIPVTTSECTGCKKLDAYLDDSWHPLSCMPLSGRYMTDRHNLVLDIFARFCRLMQVTVRQEPSGLSHDTNKRPDLQISLLDRTLLAGITITHPCAKFWR